MARAGYGPTLSWFMTEWPALEMLSIVVAPGLAKSIFLELDLRDDLRLTYTLFTTNSKNRVEQHLRICHQPGHGYHIYLLVLTAWNLCIDWLTWQEPNLSWWGFRIGEKESVLESTHCCDSREDPGGGGTWGFYDSWYTGGLSRKREGILSLCLCYVTV